MLPRATDDPAIDGDRPPATAKNAIPNSQYEDHSRLSRRWCGRAKCLWPGRPAAGASDSGPSINPANYRLTGDREHFGAYFDKIVEGVPILGPAIYLKLRRQRPNDRDRSKRLGVVEARSADALAVDLARHVPVATHALYSSRFVTLQRGNPRQCNSTRIGKKASPLAKIDPLLLGRNDPG